jgi:hypothetical protein
MSLLLAMGKLLEKAILEVVEMQVGEKNLLHASQLDIRPRHSTTLQCMSLTDLVALNFNNSAVYGYGILGYGKSLRHYLAAWPVT